jgi:excisionase family DNA binding protein
MTAPVLQARLQRLKKALDAHRQALEGLESALLEFEEALMGESSMRPEKSREGLELLSIPAVCQELDMGKSWVYRQIKGGELPSVKLGRSIKITRQDLEDYLESHRYAPASEER